MRRLTIWLSAAALLSASASGQARQELDNVAAFTRLYGVVRYFYPSDAASSVDWTRFAIHGVKRVRPVSDARQLEVVLMDLFSALGPGIDIGTSLAAAPPPGSSSDRLIAWRYLGPGISPAGGRGPYRGKRTNRALVSAETIDGFVSVMQALPGESLRGKTIRLRAFARAATRDANSAAALWLRVDRPNQQMGFFDNMADRPIREPEWREYTIEGLVADDAIGVAFGVMASGAVTADFDRTELSMRETDGSWKGLPIDDAGFEGTGQGGSAGWRRVGTSATAQMTRPADKSPEGQQFLRFSPATVQQIAGTELFPATPAEGSHVDVDLGSGLKARVRLALTDGEAITHASARPQLEGLTAALDGIRDADEVPGNDREPAGGHRHQRAHRCTGRCGRLVDRGRDQ
jgi:hypothetical protein